MASPTFANFIGAEYDSSRMKPEDWWNAMNEYLNKPAPVFTSIRQMIDLLGPYMSKLLLPLEPNYPIWQEAFPRDKSALLDKIGNWHMLPNRNLWSFLDSAAMEHFVAATMMHENIAEILLSEASHQSHELANIRVNEFNKIMATPQFNDELDNWRKLFKGNRQHPTNQQDPAQIKKQVFQVPEAGNFGDVFAGNIGGHIPVAANPAGEIPMLDEDDEFLGDDDFVEEDE